MEEVNNLNNLVIDFLRKNKDGLTITDLVNSSGVSRSTIRVVLARLGGAEKIYFRKIGMAKVYHLGRNNEKS